MDELTSTAGIVALAASAIALAALVTAVVALAKLRRVRAAQVAVLGPSGETDLVAHAAAIQHDFEALHAYVTDVAARLDGRIGTAEHRLDGALLHRGLVRYDAYNEMSGRQSTTVALLDASQSGVVLSSIHHREQARVYAKQVFEGRGELELSPEEQEALRLAMASEPPPRIDAPEA